MQIKPSYMITTVELMMIGYAMLYYDLDLGPLVEFFDGDESEEAVREGLQKGQVAGCKFSTALGEALLLLNDTQRIRARKNFWKSYENFFEQPEEQA
jgi:hypothetical protein